MRISDWSSDVCSSDLADVIVLCGVHFMAETAKILNPGKTVLLPDAGAGCSLADSITAADIRLMRERNSGGPGGTYGNNEEEGKAEEEVGGRTGKALKGVESLGKDRVNFRDDGEGAGAV